MGFAIRALALYEKEVEQELTSGVRGAVRFPIHLPIRVIASGEEHLAQSENFSSNGVLFRMPRPIQEGTPVEFLVEIPGGILGLQHTAAIHCSGRVIRSFEKNGVYYAGTVIDEYRFQ